MGDFNARVGRGGPETTEVVGPWGPPEVNDAGERLIEFCEEQELVISSTFHPKAARGSWQHPPSKKWYLIDHVVVRKSDAALFGNHLKFVSHFYPPFGGSVRIRLGDLNVRHESNTEDPSGMCMLDDGSLAVVLYSADRVIRVGGVKPLHILDGLN